MKLSFSALSFAAMAGSVSASLTFNPPIPFTQYDGDCSGDVLYKGEVVSIKKMEYGSFCVVDNISVDGETLEAFSRVDIVQCEADKIYENWNKCSDAECSECEAEYKAYTGWDSIAPTNLVGHCYDYTFSADAISKSVRKVAGTFENTQKVNFAFDPESNPEDAEAYVKLMDDNSCIAYGPPDVDTNMESPSAEGEEAEESAGPSDDETASGAITVGATATVALAAATAMMMV